MARSTGAAVTRETSCSADRPPKSTTSLIRAGSATNATVTGAPRPTMTPTMHLHAAAIARAVDGTLAGPDVVVSGATQDSRALRPGQLFIPVVAERDGHDFVADALGAGAAAYLSAR